MVDSVLIVKIHYFLNDTLRLTDRGTFIDYHNCSTLLLVLALLKQAHR